MSSRKPIPANAVRASSSCARENRSYPGFSSSQTLTRASSAFNGFFGRLGVASGKRRIFCVTSFSLDVKDSSPWLRCGNSFCRAAAVLLVDSVWTCVSSADDALLALLVLLPGPTAVAVAVEAGHNNLRTNVGHVRRHDGDRQHWPLESCADLPKRSPFWPYGQCRRVNPKLMVLTCARTHDSNVTVDQTLHKVTCSQRIDKHSLISAFPTPCKKQVSIRLHRLHKKLFNIS